METTDMVQLINRWKNARRAFYAKDYMYVDEVIAIVERYPKHMESFQLAQTNRFLI